MDYGYKNQFLFIFLSINFQKIEYIKNNNDFIYPLIIFL